MRGSRLSWIMLASALASGFLPLGCTDYGEVPTVPVVPVGPPITGLHVVGNHLEDGQGTTVVLRGVNRSGSEYQCVGGGSVFDGAWGIPSIAAIAAWKANAVRIPLNESCWLSDASSIDGGYRKSIGLFVDLLHQFHIVPILELHWVGPGTSLAVGQQPMPDADHAIDFWTSVAGTFAADDGVVLELYNEPFPDSDKDTPAAWQCWRDGCSQPLWTFQTNAMGKRVWAASSTTYQALGMQALIDAIRTVAPKHLILVGGIQYSNSLSQWMAYAPVDSNVAAAWHIYDFNGCKSTTCWDGAPAALAANLPIVATEIGQRDCMGTFIDPLMGWLDTHGVGYLAWSWNTGGSCSTSNPWPLVTDYDSGNPNGVYAQTFHDHLAAIVGGPQP
jgi:endoglucanase